MTSAIGPIGASTDERRRYLTLADARALDCNGCGDCCQSSRTDGFWTWGALPRDQYRAFLDGQPLIIPVMRRTDDAAGWRDRDWRPGDDSDATPTPFRCSAFRPQPDGRGLCGIHDRERPAKCGEFPVHLIGQDEDVRARGVMHLETSAFPRCTWFRMDAVAEGDPALDPQRGCVDSDGYVVLGELPPSMITLWAPLGGTLVPPTPHALPLEAPLDA